MTQIYERFRYTCFSAKHVAPDHAWVQGPWLDFEPCQGEFLHTFLYMCTRGSPEKFQSLNINQAGKPALLFCRVAPASSHGCVMPGHQHLFWLYPDVLQCIQNFFAQILFDFIRMVSHSISPKFSGKIPYVLSKPRICFWGPKIKQFCVKQV